MESVIRLLIIEDQPIVAEGTAQVMRAAGFEVTGIAPDLDSGLALIDKRPADVIICDVMFGDSPVGLQLPARLRADGHSATPVVFLSAYEAPYYLAQAVREGAAGFLRKSAPIGEITSVVRAAAAGEASFRVATLQQAASHRAPSQRERDIIAELANGSANAEIATRLRISEKTVESHLARLFVRYSVASRTQLAMLAQRQGWLPL